MVCDVLNVLLNGVCQYFVEDFSVYVHQQYLPILFFLMSLCGFGIRIMLASQKEFESLPSSWIFWNSL